MTNLLAIIIIVVVLAAFGFCDYKALCAKGKLQKNHVKMEFLDSLRDNLDCSHLKPSELKLLEQIASKITRL